MRRKKKRPQPQAISLFPFLAVLICTFGVLIILLVIVVKAADVKATSAKAAQQKSHQQKIRELKNELELQEIRIEGISSIRPELVDKLASEKNQRAHIQADINHLSDQFQTLIRQLKLLDSKNVDVDKEQLQAELEILSRQLTDETDLLVKKRNAAKNEGQKTYSVVPYDAPGGSKRKPIYIECLADGFVIQPYGIKLSQRDFVQPILPNNPLDAALISVREYYLKNKLIDDEAPYPLLIVRPQGAGTYALARHAIKTWDEEFGYELIPAEMELEFGEPDPQLREQMELAVNAAKRRQNEFLVQQQLNRAESNHTNVKFATGGLQASGRFGGFVKPDGRVMQTSAQQQIAAPKKRSETDALSGESVNGAKKEADIKANVDSSGSIADEKGKNWALPSSANGAIAYHRPVRVFLRPDSMVMNSDSRSSRSVVVSLDDPKTALEDLVQAIWERMDTWGVAGAGGYWKPELSVIVMPGAEGKFAEVKRLLVDSGIEAKEYHP